MSHSAFSLFRCMQGNCCSRQGKVGYEACFPLVVITRLPRPFGRWARICDVELPNCWLSAMGYQGAAM